MKRIRLTGTPRSGRQQGQVKDEEAAAKERKAARAVLDKAEVAVAAAEQEHRKARASLVTAQCRCSKVQMAQDGLANLRERHPELLEAVA